MRHCRTSKIDDVIDIVRNESCDFNPEPDTLPRVSEFIVLNHSFSARTVPNGVTIQL